MTKRLLILVSAIVAVVLTAAACGARAAATNVSGTGSTTVATRQIGGLGSVLVGATGLPLYANLQDSSSMSHCDGTCATIWKPVTVTGKATESGTNATLGTIARADGTKQVTIDGRPVYTFVEDHPGQVTGNGFHDQFGSQRFTWHVVLGSGAMSATSQGGSAGASSGSSSGSQSGGSGGLYGSGGSRY